MSKNLLLNFFLTFLLIWVFVNNYLFDYKLSFLVLLFLVILFLNFSIYVKWYIKVLFYALLWYLVWIIISFICLVNINNNFKLINNYLDNSHNISFQINNLEKLDDRFKIYSSKLISIDDKKITKNIEFLSFIPLNYNLRVWDILNSKTKLYLFKNKSSFKYKDYMLSKNIYFKSYINSFNKIWYKQPNIIFLKLKEINNELMSTIKKLYPKNEAIFLWGILLWARENIPKEVKDNFNNSWLTHFIAVSWFNITILIIFFWLFLKFFPITVRLFLLTIFIILFVLLVWFSISVVRAAIMWLLWYYILALGRKSNNYTIILITAFLLVLYSPLSISYDVSLHLSFLAVLWIIYTQNFFSKIFYFLPEFLAIKESFILTLSALTFSLPILIFNFWQVSILSIIANIVVAWTIPISMLLWFLSIIVYYIYIPIWWILAYITWIFLKWDMIMVWFFWNQNWALIKINLWKYSSYLELTYFIILVFIIIYFYPNKKEKNIIFD